MNVNKLIAAILSAVPRSMDETGTTDMMNQSSWPTWATHAVTYRDRDVWTGKTVRAGVLTLFFGSESEYYSWMADAYQRVHYTCAIREVTSYEWDLGPNYRGFQTITAQSLR